MLCSEKKDFNTIKSPNSQLLRNTQREFISEQRKIPEGTHEMRVKC